MTFPRAATEVSAALKLLCGLLVVSATLMLIKPAESLEINGIPILDLQPVVNVMLQGEMERLK